MVVLRRTSVMALATAPMPGRARVTAAAAARAASAAAASTAPSPSARVPAHREKNKIIETVKTKQETTGTVPSSAYSSSATCSASGGASATVSRWMTRTGFFWPMRCDRATACSSFFGLASGSYMMTVSAVCAPAATVVYQEFIIFLFFSLNFVLERNARAPAGVHALNSLHDRGRGGAPAG